MNGLVRVEKRKWDGSVKAAGGGRLLTCRRGRVVWATIPDGADAPDGEIRVTSTGHWWVAALRGAGHEGAAYAIDISLPVRVRPGLLSFIDLDLDLVGPSLAGLELQDEDEFRERAAGMGYPPWVRRGAWMGVCEVRRLTGAGAWPFDGSVGPSASREG